MAAAAWRDLCSYFIRNIICSAPGSQQQQAARVQDTTVELQTKVFEDYAKLYTAATLALLYAPYEEVLMIFYKIVWGNHIANLENVGKSFCMLYCASAKLQHFL